MNKILLTISAVTLLTATGYIFYSSTETASETDIVKSTFELYPEIPANIQDIDVSFVPQQKVTIEELSQTMDKVSLKMSAIMESGDENKLQFYGKLYGIAKKAGNFVKRVAIPAFNMVKSTIDVVATPIHDACNPQGSIAAFLSRAIQSIPQVMKICKFNNYYVKGSNVVSDFANKVGNMLRSSYSQNIQNISEGQAEDYMDRVINYSVNMDGSLGARLRCVEKKDELYRLNQYMLQQIENLLDQESCNPSYDSNCQQVSSMDFYENERLSIQSNSQQQMVQVGEKIAYNMSYVEACKRRNIFFQGDL